MSALASHCSDERNYANSGEMYYGIVILGLVLALVLAQERQDNRPQHLTHVGSADQVSLYNHQIWRSQCLTSPGGHGEDPCLIWILKFCEKWTEDQLTLIFEPVREISNNVVCETSKASDQPAHTRSLIRAYASRLSILWLLSYWLNTIWSF